MEFPQKIYEYRRRAKNKEATMRVLINAVGEIIRTEGHPGLGVNNIAAKAGADKVLIYRYFGSSENLIETYLKEKDPWKEFSEKIRNKETDDKSEVTEMVTGMLENQFNFFMKDIELQQLMLGEMAGKSEFINTAGLKRTSIYSVVFNLMDQGTKKDPIDVKLLSYLLSAGLYFIVLQNDSGGALDLNNPAHVQKVKQTVGETMALAFKEREKPI